MPCRARWARSRWPPASCWRPPLPETSGRLLQKALGGHRFLHLGARGDAIEEGLECRPAAEVDTDEVAPARDHEQVRIGDREVVAGQVLPAGELPVEPVELLLEVLRGVFLHLRVGRGIEQRRETLVELAGDEVQPLEQAVTFE